MAVALVVVLEVVVVPAAVVAILIEDVGTAGSARLVAPADVTLGAGAVLVRLGNRLSLVPGPTGLRVLVLPGRMLIVRIPDRIRLVRDPIVVVVFRDRRVGLILGRGGLFLVLTLRRATVMPLLMMGKRGDHGETEQSDGGEHERDARRECNYPAVMTLARRLRGVEEDLSQAQMLCVVGHLS
jgi:hypothetical protein